MDNVGNYGTQLRNVYWRFPALQPVAKHLERKTPGKPRKAKFLNIDGKRVIFWQAPKEKKWNDIVVKYAIYRFDAKEKINIDDATKMVAVTADTFYELPAGERIPCVYVVTALNRVQNESKIIKVKVKK